jgi:hypothetical protein
MGKTLQYFWGHLSNPVKGFRPKTFPVSLTGLFRGRFSKAL